MYAKQWGTKPPIFKGTNAPNPKRRVHLQIYGISKLNGLKINNDDVRVTSLNVIVLLSLLLMLNTLSILFLGGGCQILVFTCLTVLPVSANVAFDFSTFSGIGEMGHWAKIS